MSALRCEKCGQGVREVDGEYFHLGTDDTHFAQPDWKSEAERLRSKLDAAVAVERMAIREIVAQTAASSGPMNSGDKEWREACQCIDDLIVARGGR